VHGSGTPIPPAPLDDTRELWGSRTSSAKSRPTCGILVLVGVSCMLLLMQLQMCVCEGEGGLNGTGERKYMPHIEISVHQTMCCQVRALLSTTTHLQGT